MALIQITEPFLSVKKLDNLHFDGLVQKEDLKPTVGQFLRYIEDHTDLSNEDKKILAVSNLKSFAKNDIKTKLKHDWLWPTMKRYLFDQYRCQLTLKEKIELRRYLIQREEENVNDFHDRCIKAQYMLCDDNADSVLERDIIINFISGIKEDVYQIIIRIEPLSTLDICLKNASEIEDLLQVNDVANENGIDERNYFEYDNENCIDDKNYIDYGNGMEHFMSESTLPEEVKIEVKLEEDSYFSDHHLSVDHETEEDLKIETIKSKALKENEYDSLPDEVLLENDHDNNKDASSIGNDDADDSNFEPTEKELNMVKPKIVKENLCLFCSKVFSTERQLKKHLSMAHDQDVDLKIWQCDICGKKLMQGETAKFKHFKAVHPEDYKTLNEKVCELCPKNKHKHFTPLTLAVHKNIYHPIVDPSNNKNILCHTCRQSFSGRLNLKKHIKVDHLKIKLPQCDACLKDFFNEIHLKNHVENSLCKKEAILQCEHCDKSFKSQRYLHEHGIRAHPNLVYHGQMKIPCEICGKLMSKANIKHHMRRTHSDQIFICDFCGKEFKAEEFVQKHKVRAHMSKTIKCTIEGCDRLFSSKSNMNHHKRSCHTVKQVLKRKEKRVVCDQCLKRFAGSASLAGHKAAFHGGPKQFKCKESDCDYEAAHKETLNQHIKTKHMNVMFECSFPGCGLKKNSKGNIDKHMKFSHGIPLPSERKKQKIYIDGTADDITNVDSGLSSTSQDKPSSYYLQRRARLT